MGVGAVGGPLCRICDFSGHFGVHLKLTQNGVTCRLQLKNKENPSPIYIMQIWFCRSGNADPDLQILFSQKKVFRSYVFLLFIIDSVEDMENENHP